MRALSVAEILDGLHDRFRLLTGGARTAVRRQQTLRASVDWSHALLTEPERVLFRRLASARRWADDSVAATRGHNLAVALTTRARVANMQGEPEQAERDAHDALVRAAEVEAYVVISDILECLATLAGDAGNHEQAARLFGAADGARRHSGTVRFKIWDAGYEASLASLRDALGENDFDAAWAEGAALSTEEAIAYARRGRGERKRPATGWGVTHSG